MYKFYTKGKCFRFCFLSFLIIFAVTVFSTRRGKTDNFPPKNELPSSTYADTHGSKRSYLLGNGRAYYTAVDAHSHALASAHSDRSGFFVVYAKTYKAPFAPWWLRVKTKKDEDSNYFRYGCHRFATVNYTYTRIDESNIAYFAESRVWDNTGAKDGETNWGGLVYEDELHGR